MALAFESPMSQNIPKMDSGLQRPQSALARGVQITELSDGCMNPEPIIMQETDILMEQYLSPTKLQLLTGSDNLENVDTLELRVDTSDTSLNNFGALLPNLRVLKLSGSIVPNIRDLGSSLHHLQVLWMSRCALEEIDGIASMLNLRELYLSYNEIKDISALSMLEELLILDLEGNNIEDIGQVQYLTLCSRLQHLTLDGNPICVAPTPEAEEPTYDYRQAVYKILPKLETLDDKSLTEVECASPQNVFDADWAYLEELQKDAVLNETEDNDKETVSAAGRPTTAALRPATSYRPGSALRPSSGFRPSSAARRPASISGGRPSTAWTDSSRRRPASSDAAEGMESASELTCGTVICGNPSKALRARRRRADSEEHIEDSEPSSTQLSSKSESLASAILEEKGRSPISRKEEEEELGAVGGGPPLEEKDLTDLMKELMSWKIDHEKRLEKIRQSKAPQVFTIDHIEDAVLSDNDSDPDDKDDLDLRPDSAMDLYRHQQEEKVLRARLSETSHSGAGASRFGLATAADEAYTMRFSSPEDENSSPGRGASQGLSTSAFEAASASVSVASRPSRFKMSDYEKSLDDEKLLREYEQLREIRQKHKDRLVSPTGSPRELNLKEVRVPSAGFRPPSPRRTPNPLSMPFPTSGGLEFAQHALGQEALLPRELRPKKVKIGPTGLPGSSQTSQPQIRNILTPPGKSGLTPGKSGLSGLGALLPPGSQRPSSGATTTLQHRIRRTLPEVPPLPSRPPPITKS